MYICSACGEKIEAPGNFCPNCGFPLYADVVNGLSLCQISEPYKATFALHMKSLKRDTRDLQVLTEVIRKMQEDINSLKQKLEMEQDEKISSPDVCKEILNRRDSTGAENSEAEEAFTEEGLVVIDGILTANKNYRAHYIKIPEEVTVIRGMAFADCTEVWYVKFPKNLKMIKGNAFRGAGLKEIIIPSGIKEILPWTFVNCRNLETVTLNGDIKKIQRGAFFGCDAMETIYIPDSVMEIGESAFAECQNLRLVSMPKTTVCGRDVFRNTNCKVVRR